MSSHAKSTSKPIPRWKVVLKRAWPTIRILLSIGLLWKATSGIDWHALLDSQIQMQPWWFLAALLSMLSAFICGGIRWGFLMRKVGFQASLKNFIALYLAGGQLGEQQTISVVDQPMCLHAWRLTFTHPETKQRIELTAEPDWNNFQ